MTVNCPILMRLARGTVSCANGCKPVATQSRKRNGEKYGQIAEDCAAPAEAGADVP